MSAYPPGTRVEVFHGQAWYPAVVVHLERPDRHAWWPDVDYTRAVAVRLADSVNLTTRGERGYDLLIGDPESDLIRPAGSGGRRHLRGVS